MKIHNNESIVIAQKVLAELRKMEPGKKTDIYMNNYANFREQGFFLTNYEGIRQRGARSAVFSQSRGSDMIVVYCAWRDDFNPANGVPFERADQFWQEYDCPKKAAQAVYNWLVNGRRKRRLKHVA